MKWLCNQRNYVDQRDTAVDQNHSDQLLYPFDLNYTDRVDQNYQNYQKK